MNNNVVLATQLLGQYYSYQIHVSVYMQRLADCELIQYEGPNL